jgi:hypothetical protein
MAESSLISHSSLDSTEVYDLIRRAVLQS